MKRLLSVVIATVALLALVACGGGGSSSTTTTTNASSAPITVNVGDAQADRLVAFEVTVNSVTLTGSAGTTANLLAAPTKIELTHLSGKFEPLRIMSVPAGSYTGATIQLGSAEAVIIGAAGTAQAGAVVKVQNITPNPASVTITFPAITVGTTASVLNFDFNLGTSVTVTGNSVTFAPSASAVTVVTAAAGQNENEQEDEDGELEDIHGTVAQVNSSSFVLNVGGSTSQQLTFNVDATTQFSDGITAFSGLKAGMVVKVEGITKSDGSLLAKEVEGVEVENGLEAEGIITATNLTAGVGTITVVVHDASSAAAAASQPSADDTITVNIAANTQFKVDFGQGKTKTSDPGLAFDGTHLGKGQKVEADDDIAEKSNLTQVKKLRLKKQALVGTVSNAGANGFTLTLDSANSFFTQLTGESVIQVKTTSATINKNGTPANGSTIRVRGLLFFDPAQPTGSKYTMAAGRTDH